MRPGGANSFQLYRVSEARNLSSSMACHHLYLPQHGALDFISLIIFNDSRSQRRYPVPSQAYISPLPHNLHTAIREHMAVWQGRRKAAFDKHQALHLKGGPRDNEVALLEGIPSTSEDVRGVNLKEEGGK